MRLLNLEGLEKLVKECKEDIWAVADEVNRYPKIYLHWTAGSYLQKFEDYHINITGDGKIYLSEDDLSEVLAHTWKRNTGAIGVTLCCAFNADTEDLGEYPPKEVQIETMAQVIAVLASGLEIPIDKYHVLTHGEAADNEDGVYEHEYYGPKNGCERWDLEYLGTKESPEFDPYSEMRGGDVLRGKALFYQNAFNKSHI